MKKYYRGQMVSLQKCTLPNEKWKDIKGYEGMYKVSSLGRIYSYVCGRLLKTNPHKTYGYVCIPLGKRKDGKSFRVHRLVAEAFIPNPYNKKEVNHKNKIKSDNSVENLEWMSGVENNNHRFGNIHWHKDQDRISPSDYSVKRRALEGFSKVIIPMINELVPL